jgi:hypothetical protein
MVRQTRLTDLPLGNGLEPRPQEIVRLDGTAPVWAARAGAARRPAGGHPDDAVSKDKSPLSPRSRRPTPPTPLQKGWGPSRPTLCCSLSGQRIEEPHKGEAGCRDQPEKHATPFDADEVIE